MLCTKKPNLPRSSDHVQRFVITLGIDAVLALHTIRRPRHNVKPPARNRSFALRTPAELAAIEPLQGGIDQLQFLPVHPVLAQNNELIKHQGSLILHRKGTGENE